MLETNRIKLVSPCMTRQPQMLEAIIESKEELAEFLVWVPYALTEAESIANMEQAISNFDNFEQELRYSIIDKSNDKLVGAIGIIIKDKLIPYFEIGYWVRSSCTGKGYVTEAVQLIEQYCFSELKAKRVEIQLAELNYKSKAVAERCGYLLEGHLKNAFMLPDGRVCDRLIYGKTKR